MNEDKLSTQEDLALLNQNISFRREELANRIVSLQGSLNKELILARQNFTKESEAFRREFKLEMKILSQDLIIKLGGIMVGGGIALVFLMLLLFVVK